MSLERPSAYAKSSRPRPMGSDLRHSVRYPFRTGLKVHLCQLAVLGAVIESRALNSVWAEQGVEA